MAALLGWLDRVDAGAGLAALWLVCLESGRDRFCHHRHEGEIVFEPFWGSDTTILAGQACGRTVYASEFAPERVDMALIRWIKTPISHPGDVWVMGQHRLLRGDATQRASYERLLAGQRVVRR